MPGSSDHIRRGYARDLIPPAMPRPVREPRIVAWGWRPGDIQLNSDEDWERQTRLAESWYRRRWTRSSSALAKSFAEVGRTARRAGLQITSGYRTLAEQQHIYYRSDHFAARALASGSANLFGYKPPPPPPGDPIWE